MHIPDGFLDGKTILVTGGIGAAVVAAAVFHAQRTLPSRKVPLMGLSAAFVFAAQLINFPVAGGTSGHLVGSVLTAILLGPSAAILVLSAVLITQCLLYGDGGVTALGANIVNMGLIGGVLGYAIYAGVSRMLPATWGKLVGAAAACWMTTVIAAAVCAGEVAASGRVPLGKILPAMLTWHGLIGVGEAVITILVLLAVRQSRPELLQRGEAVAAGAGGGVVRYGMTAFYGLLIALAIALFASPWAVQWPDGLERAAADTQVAAQETKLVSAPMNDYQLPAVRTAGVSKAVAGGIGTLVVFAGCLGAAGVIRRRKPR